MHRAGVKCPGWFDANYNTDKSSAGGYCMITDLEGEKPIALGATPATQKPAPRMPARSSAPASAVNTKR